MEYKAKVSFAGKLSMHEGEVKELDDSLASEFVECGFLEKTDTESNEKNISDSDGKETSESKNDNAQEDEGNESQ